MIQLFELLIPAELTQFNEPYLKVAVRVERDDNGNFLTRQFLGLDTYTVVRVKDWFKLWDIAKETAETLWHQQQPKIKFHKI